jgi:hypothetical protein
MTARSMNTPHIGFQANIVWKILPFNHMDVALAVIPFQAMKVPILHFAVFNKRYHRKQLTALFLSHSSFPKIACCKRHNPFVRFASPSGKKIIRKKPNLHAGGFRLAKSKEERTHPSSKSADLFALLCDGCPKSHAVNLGKKSFSRGEANPN